MICLVYSDTDAVIYAVPNLSWVHTGVLVPVSWVADDRRSMHVVRTHGMMQPTCR